MSNVPEEILTLIEELATYYCSGGETDKSTIKHYLLWELSDACVKIDNPEVLEQVDYHIDYCIKEMKDIRSSLQNQHHCTSAI